ncbi:MAG: cbb3-type cytochrome c oxidase subunit 3 [Parasphingorhabdus sp.]|uniref:cbb3-type cytochrome c oxidase subunit 3 n=1 Tax=Parasphingorhabdus sp. TaxID=2709688 RepID=UPI003001BCFA
MTYEEFRHFADSWGLLFLGMIFLTFVGWSFRPGSRQKNEEAAHMIFEEDQDDG